jgi:hypothetical protein
MEWLISTRILNKVDLLNSRSAEEYSLECHIGNLQCRTECALEGD